MKLEHIKMITGALCDERTSFYYRRGHFANMLLQWHCTAPTDVRTLKRSRFGTLMTQARVRDVIARNGDGRIHATDFERCLKTDGEHLILTLDQWGGHSARVQQTSREGHNLVIQVNFCDDYRRWFEQCVIRERQYHFDFLPHPVMQQRQRGYRLDTLGWARVDLDFDTGEALIEEVQSDWIRECRQLLKSCNKGKKTRRAWRTTRQYCEHVLERWDKSWSEAVLAAAIKVVHEVLGVSTIWYHTAETGALMKSIAGTLPPRSLYTTLPKRFCFERVRDEPRFVGNIDAMLRRRFRCGCCRHWRHLAKRHNREWHLLQLPEHPANTAIEQFFPPGNRRNKPMIKPRNPVVRHATVLRKGGPHHRTDTACRQRSRLEIEDEAEAFMLERRRQSVKTIAGDSKEGSGDAHIPFVAHPVSAPTMIVDRGRGL